jgi:adenine-specific DNA-methyltransferase
MNTAEIDLLGKSQELQERFEAGTSQDHRKNRGQFFTPKPICQFMARLLTFPDGDFRLLDPGAGVGALTAAVCNEFCRLGSSRCLEVHVFENDPKAVDLLAENMRACRVAAESAGHTMEYFIHATDFVEAVGKEFDKSRGLFSTDSGLGRFDAVIMNPPYFKIAKDSRHARLMASIVHGQPNIYAIFLALAADLLRPEGEMVAITPRSFCNGLYFRGFRKWFLRRMSLEHLHLFESRTETFQGAGILQESIITLARRSTVQSPVIRVSTSESGHVRESLPYQTVSAANVIEDATRDILIRIPMSDTDTDVMETIESLPVRFAETGLRISTGPVVMFRAKEFLVEEPHGRDTVPLLLPHNVKPFDTIWPVQKQRKPTAFRVCSASRRLLLSTRNYVLLKRFSAKEERRRLTAGCFLASRQSHDYAAVENHLNYIYHESRDLSENEVFGIAALLNSNVYDRYFRLLSGSTQVNATEMRTIKFPPLSLVEALGKRVVQTWPLGEAALDVVVQETLTEASAVSPVLAESLM